LTSKSRSPGRPSTCALELEAEGARLWAAELFAAVSIAYREATGDRSALDDGEIAGLVHAISIGPGTPAA
jgi:hypothetical protein